MKFYISTLIAAVSIGFFSCGNGTLSKDHDLTAVNADSNFVWQTEQFADLRILRYKVPGFDELASQQKEMLYYLYEAALCGRDIIWDQNCKYNLTVRHTLEAIVNSHDKNDASSDWKKFMFYTKRVWFSNGIHHHYGNEKILPEFSEAYFAELISKAESKNLPLGV